MLVSHAEHLMAELLEVQRPQPITEELELDPESEIQYSCEKDLRALAAAEGCEAVPDAARCASIGVGEATLTVDKPSSSSCTKRIICSGGQVEVCHTCKTCCRVGQDSTTCTTSCGWGRIIIWP